MTQGKPNNHFLSVFDGILAVGSQEPHHKILEKYFCQIWLYSFDVVQFFFIEIKVVRNNILNNLYLNDKLPILHCLPSRSLLPAQQHSDNVRGFLLHYFQRCEFDLCDVQQLFGTPFRKVSLR